MTERNSEPPASGQRMTTGEFRATPDISASTAQFKAFAAEQGELTGQFGVTAASRSRARLALLIGAVILVVAVIAILVVTLG
jgi:hypothetical protein